MRVKVSIITAEVFSISVGQAATTTTPGHLRPDCLLPSVVGRHLLAPHPAIAELPQGANPLQAPPPRFSHPPPPSVYLTGSSTIPSPSTTTTTGASPAGGFAAGGESATNTPATTVGNYGEESEAEPSRKRRKMSTVSMDSASTAGEEEVRLF